MTDDAAGGANATATGLASRDELLREHAEQRHRRDAAPLGSDEYQAAAIRIGEIEVEIARLERAVGVG